MNSYRLFTFGIQHCSDKKNRSATRTCVYPKVMHVCLFGLFKVILKYDAFFGRFLKLFKAICMLESSKWPDISTWKMTHLFLLSLDETAKQLIANSPRSTVFADDILGTTLYEGQML